MEHGADRADVPSAGVRRWPAARRAAAAALLLLVLTGAGSARAADTEQTSAAANASRGSSLFEAAPLGFDADTVARLGTFLRSLPSEAPQRAHAILERGRRTGAVGSAALVAFVAIVLVAILLQGRLGNVVERRAAPACANLPGGLRPWALAVARVAAATLLPLGLWLVHDVLTRATGFTGPGFLLIPILLRAWLRYALVVSVLRELVLRPLIPIAPEHGRYLYGIGRGLAVYGLLLYALLEVGDRAGVDGDMLALAKALFDLSLLVLLALFATRKQAVLALLPDLPNRFYRAFRTGLGHAYPLILVLTFATALLAWAGYGELADFVWVRSWALVGLFLASVIALHGVRVGLHAWLGAAHDHGDAAARLHRSLARLADYGAVLLVGSFALDLIALREPLGNAVGVPIYSLGDRPVSIPMLLEGALVVAAFCLIASVLRDFLSYRVYPALRVEESIAHAINLFITYAMAVVGVLFALEYVGLGVGTVTVFAGALGIGLGFGMQTLANNLASGLTLVFGRALRKGDWVNVGETFGCVEEVGMRATRVVTRDAVEYVVPNAEFVGGTIVNWTGASPLVREHVPVSVAYDSDPEAVIALLIAIARETRFVEQSPPPDVWLTGFGASSLDFDLLVWIDLRLVPRQQVRSDLYRAILRGFRTAGIEIPYPQSDVHLRSLAPEIVETAVRAVGRAPAADPGARTRRQGRRVSGG